MRWLLLYRISIQNTTKYKVALLVISLFSSMNRIRTLLPIKRRARTKTTRSRADHENTASIPVLASNHLMVNLLRRRCGAPLLQRSRTLDEFARTQAEYMAQTQALSHFVDGSQELKDIFECNAVAQNVQRGASIHAMHSSTVQTKSARLQNLLSKDFKEFGMGTARCATDGKLYMCQVLRG